MGVVSTTGGHGFQLITFLLEQGPEGLVMLWVIIAAIATKCLDQVSVPGLHAPKGELNILGFESENAQFEMNWAFFTYVFIAVPIVSIGIPVVKLVVGSFYCTDGHAKADWSEWLEITDASLASAWAGKKIPYCVMYENYMREKIHFKQDFLETMLHREELFAASFTTHDLMHYINTFITQNLGHSPLRDKDEVATVYNRGNDFYGFFLGEPMKYSCGIYRSVDDSLEEAQYRMLDLVCRQGKMEEGQNHFDFGCGWGSLVTYSAEHFGVNSYGITLSEEQAKFGIQRTKDHGVADNVRIMVQDYRTVLEDHPEIPKVYDVITCLEMAEHVGIKNFQSFLLQVRSMLKPDGVFYLQIAGLRRAWQYEDLVWGLFMNKYIFPAADASCPLGFVISQLERAGFENHRSENTGVHYALTIKAWYYNWIENKDEVIEAYGEYYYRMWIVFLGWSTIVAGQGSSTVFMTTNTINHGVDVETSAIDTGVIHRTNMWVGEDTIGIQQ